MKEKGLRASTYFQQLARDATKIVTLSYTFPEPNPLEEVLNEYSELFSGHLGTVKEVECETKLISGAGTVTPYHCTPPKLKLLKEFVEDLLQKGVVRPSKYAYASPTFLLPKSEGGYRIVADNSKVNKKICFDSYPLPKIEQAFQHFSEASVFCNGFELRLLSNTLIPQRRRIAAFCSPFRFYEFNLLAPEFYI
jgi:hypothetical protein